MNSLSQTFNWIAALLVVGCVLLWGTASRAAPMPVPTTDMTPTAQVLLQQELQQIPANFYAVSAVEDLRRKIDQEEVLLVDVRQPREYLFGHIDGAVNIPLRELANRTDEIPQDRPVVIYCSTGYRSGMGVLTLHLLGYGNVEGFPPSYVGWKQAGAD